MKNISIKKYNKTCYCHRNLLISFLKSSFHGDVFATYVQLLETRENTSIRLTSVNPPWNDDSAIVPQ